MPSKTCTTIIEDGDAGTAVQQGMPVMIMAVTTGPTVAQGLGADAGAEGWAAGATPGGKLCGTRGGMT
jgi:hypothetical protein